jgi:RES domain-containing protein
MILRILGDDEPFFRMLVPKWAHRPLSGAGAATKGGRFNRPGLEALYLSLSPVTAMKEYQQLDPLMPPGLLTTYLVSRIKVVDFSGGFDPAAWEPIWADFGCNWRRQAFIDRVEPPSWVLGDLVMDAGASGLIAPSLADPGGTNLIIYNSTALPRGKLHVHDPNHDLPIDAASWGKTP